MCKEDIRLSRAASARTPRIAAAGTIQGPAFPANPNRYSLSVGLEMGNTITDMCGVMVYTMFGGERFPLLGVSTDTPVDRCTINDVGQAITGPIYIVSIGATAPDNAWVAETVWDQSLESI